MIVTVTVTVAEAAIARARARARRGTRWQSPLDVTRRRRPSAYAAVSLWCRADVVAHVSFAVLVLVVRVAQPPWRSSWAVPQRVVASHGQGLVRGRARECSASRTTYVWLFVFHSQASSCRRSASFFPPAPRLSHMSFNPKLALRRRRHTPPVWHRVRTSRCGYCVTMSTANLRSAVSAEEGLELQTNQPPRAHAHAQHEERTLRKGALAGAELGCWLFLAVQDAVRKDVHDPLRSSIHNAQA
jgi:hypothetical protein